MVNAPEHKRTGPDREFGSKSLTGILCVLKSHKQLACQAANRTAQLMNLRALMQI
jgi:hypothetical protein